MSTVNSVSAKHLHFFGIAGRGMTPLAILAKELGAQVDGCDRAGRHENIEFLERSEILVFREHDENHLQNNTELVITSIAPSENVEVSKARKEQRLKTRSELLGLIFESRQGIGVTGSHGKGTVTALTTAALESAGLDPLALIGVDIPYFSGVTRIGSGSLVAEVDDSDLSLRTIASDIVVVTNLDEDHPHLKITLNKAVEGIGEYVSRAHKLVILGPSPRSEKLALYSNAPVWKYGKNFGGKIEQQVQGITEMTLWVEGHPPQKVRSSLLTPKTEVNMSLAFAAAIAQGAHPELAARGLENITLISRRLEPIPSASQRKIFDDFGGKHPANILAGLKLLRQHFPKSRIIAVFEPYGPYLSKWGSRYSKALSKADEVVIAPPIYLADYPGSSKASETWFKHSHFTHLHVASDQQHAVDLAISLSPSDEIVVFFAQIHNSKQMALSAAEVG